MADLYCPYCGSRHFHQVGERYVCDDCQWLFDEDDIRWQELRHEISHRLIDTDEEHPVVFGNHPLLTGDKECDSIFQVPGDGTIWLHLVDEYDNSDPTGLKWHDIEECDFLTANDLNSIVYHLKFN